jgi:hypothetical protein
MFQAFTVFSRSKLLFKVQTNVFNVLIKGALAKYPFSGVDG